MNIRPLCTVLLVLAVGGCKYIQPHDDDDDGGEGEVPTQTSSTVTAPLWIADHYIGNTSQGHQHTGSTIEAMAAACLAHFPKASSNTPETSGSAVHACRNPRYFVTVKYTPNVVVDCGVSPWAEWQPQQCYAPEQQTRERKVNQLPENGGEACPALTETRVCPQLPPEQQSWTRAGVEGTTITPPGERTYRYGCDDADNAQFTGCPAGDVWSPTHVFSAPFVCNNTAFDGDPIYGVEKTCQVSSVAPPPPNHSATASLKWTAPTLNTNGSPLTNLGGFRIYYGPESEPLRWSLDIASPTITNHVVTNLMGGVTFRFIVRAVNTAGAESGDSNAVSKQMP